MRVVEEFFRQGDAEAAHGLKVSPMIDRNKAAIDAQQNGFIDVSTEDAWKHIQLCCCGLMTDSVD
jgi:hypothetical protein